MPSSRARRSEPVLPTRPEASPTAAFASVLDMLPPRWPRTGWVRRSYGEGREAYLNGDFEVQLSREEDGWRAISTRELHAARRRLWWAWMVPGLLFAMLGLALIFRHGTAWWIGAFAVLLVVGARAFFDRAHRARRGGTR